jgi:hypothetical protein
MQINAEGKPLKGERKQLSITGEDGRYEITEVPNYYKESTYRKLMTFSASRRLHSAVSRGRCT